MRRIDGSLFLALCFAFLLPAVARGASNGTRILTTDATGSSSWYNVSTSSRCRMQIEVTGTASVAVEQTEDTDLDPKATWTVTATDVLNVAISTFVRATVITCTSCDVAAVLTCEKYTPQGYVDSSPRTPVTFLLPTMPGRAVPIMEWDWAKLWGGK